MRNVQEVGNHITPKYDQVVAGVRKGIPHDVRHRAMLVFAAMTAFGPMGKRVELFRAMGYDQPEIYTPSEVTRLDYR